MNDPEVRGTLNAERLEQSFAHVLAHWGTDFPVRLIKIRQVKEYMLRRSRKGAAASTINKERNALSKMFKILLENELVKRNPVRETSPADERYEQREVHISFNDFNALMGHVPTWARVIFQMLYFTGMRRGEALGLTWRQVNLKKRIITLGATDTKERRPKRVPIHRVLVPMLQKIGKLRSLHDRRVFLTSRCKPPHEDSLRKPWRTAVDAIGFSPRLRIHDLRHCWKTNAMRSGMNLLIADMIVGHGDRRKDVRAVYLTVSDNDLVREINKMKFDIGETEIWLKK